MSRSSAQRCFARPQTSAIIVFPKASVDQFVRTGSKPIRGLERLCKVLTCRQGLQNSTQKHCRCELCLIFVLAQFLLLQHVGPGGPSSAGENYEKDIRAHGNSARCIIPPNQRGVCRCRRPLQWVPARAGVGWIVYPRSRRRSLSQRSTPRVGGGSWSSC